MFGQVSIEITCQCIGDPHILNIKPLAYELSYMIIHFRCRRSNYQFINVI